MPATLLTLPEFICVEIGSWLDLKDAIAFTGIYFPSFTAWKILPFTIISQTCTAFRAFGLLRAFWVPILNRTRQEKPLNWPSGSSLTECTPEKLRNIAFHRLRLDANWARPSPNIFGPEPATRIDTKAQNIISPIPATDIVILHRSREGQLVCYDTETKQQTFQLDIPVNSHIYDSSAGLQIAGQFRKAILVDPPGCLIILCVDHMDGKATSFSKIFHAKLETNTVYCRPFLHGDHVGMISHARNHQVVHDYFNISAFSVKTGELVEIRTNLPSLPTGFNLAQVASFAFGSTLYAMIESDIELHVYQCSCSILPTCSGSSKQTEAVFERSGFYLLEDSCSYKTSYSVSLVHSGTLAYGVAASSTHQHWCGHPSGDYVVIRFWPSPMVQSEVNGDSHLVVGDAKGHNIHIPGRLRWNGGSYVGYPGHENCGTTIALVTDRNSIGAERPKISTYLVRYVAGAVSTHELKLPLAIVAEGCRIMVDDYKGTVYLLDTYGMLYCIPYA